MPRAELHRTRREHLKEPYPSGESWWQAVRRVGRFLDDLHLRWEGARVLVIGHIATRWAFEHYLNGASLDDLIDTEFNWREGWEYTVQDEFCLSSEPTMASGLYPAARSKSVRHRPKA